MSSNNNEEGQYTLPPSRQPHSISQLARIEVEEPPRKMRLMFGERQVVYIRSDGLRSRVVRANLKKKEEKGETKKVTNKNRDESDSDTLNQVINDVAKGSSNMFSCTPFPSLPDFLPPSSDLMTPEPSTSCSLSTTTSETKNTLGEASSEISDSHSDLRDERLGEKPGNRSYHPPKQFHGASTMVTHKRRWTYQTACNINAAEQSGDNQMYYTAHPFLPLPRGRRNEVCSATRMNYAAQRLDNRKFRGQVPAFSQIANNEKVFCEKCGMCYYFESIKMQERISYLLPDNDEDLPTALFDCPVCKVKTRVSS